MMSIQEAYNAWFEKIKFCSGDLYNNQEWREFLDVCKNNPKVDSFFIELLEKPNSAVFALDSVYPNTMRYNRPTSLCDVCNAWRTYLMIKNNDNNR